MTCGRSWKSISENGQWLPETDGPGNNTYLRRSGNARLSWFCHSSAGSTARLTMNYLAHAYLSFHDPDVTAGQLIGDFVKGKQSEAYPALIRKGIILHRALDEYTDSHPASRTARDIFRPATGLYGGVFLDIVYDHFLANDAERFTLPELARFSEATYQAVEERLPILPPAFRQMFAFMRTHNWLYHYHERDSILRSFGGIIRRARYFNQPAAVPYAVLSDHYEELRDCYNTFIPDAENFMKSLTIELS